MPIPYDALIIGYGPVGATLAGLLARHGLRIAVVEQAAGVYDKPRAITLDHEVMRIFQACGVAHEVAPFTAPHPGTHYLGVGREVIRIFDPQPPPYPLGWVPSGTFVQPDVEGVLRAGVARSGRADVLLATQAVALATHDDRVDVTVRAADGSAEGVLAARYVVGCDGANSFVRRALGIGHRDLAFDEWWMVVDVRLTRPVALPEKCIQYCWPERPATFILGPENLRRWEIKLLPGERPEDFGAPENVRRQLARFVDPDGVEIWRSAVYRFHALVAERWREGRVFLAGDACHQTPPFMGQGMCAGIRDAANLAWKLGLALRAGASEALLDSYERERKPHVEALINFAIKAGETIGELDVAKARARDAAMLDLLRSGRAETIRQRYIPNLTTGVLDAASGPVAGTLFVQPRVGETEDGALLDDVVAPAFPAGDDGRGGAGVAFADLARGVAAPRRRARRDRGEWRRTTDPTACGISTNTITCSPDWMAQHDAAAVVARPDRYVYGIARDAHELNRLIARLGRQVFD